MEHCHRHRHSHWGGWGSSLGAPVASPSATLVDINQQATAIAYGGGTAIAINITYVFLL